MSVEDMEGFTAVVNSDHPEEELLERPRGVIKPRDATLKSGAAIRWKFDDQGEPNLDWDQITFDPAIQFVRTFSDDGTSSWVDAIVPGLGRCQVQRDDLESQTTREGCVGDSNGGVTSLQIGFCEDDRDLWEGLPMLLSSIKFLGLDYHENGFEDILRHCPNLQELTFCAVFAVFRFNFSNYDGEIDQFDYDWRDIEALAQALNGSDNLLSKCLRHVRAPFNWLCTREHAGGPKVYKPRIKTDIEALLKMLQVNRSLEFICLLLITATLGICENITSSQSAARRRQETVNLRF